MHFIINTIIFQLSGNGATTSSELTEDTAMGTSLFCAAMVNVKATHESSRNNLFVLITIVF
jgi:hypothetical protein